MPHDYRLQEQEEAAKAEAWNHVLWDAAVLIAHAPSEMGDEAAIKLALRIAAERQAAEAAGNVQCDDEGIVIDYLETRLAYPSETAIKNPVVIAHYERLKEQFPAP